MDNISIVNNSDMNEAHRSHIVKLLNRNGVCSRAELAKMTGLTTASITKITAALIGEGILSETGVIKGSGNRRAIGLQLNSEKNLIIAVKFSRYVYTIGVFDISGKYYSGSETEFGMQDDPIDVINDIKKKIHQCLAVNKNVIAIGMAVPGPYLKYKGRIAMMSRLSAWNKVNFEQEFADEFHIPFFIEQDANSGAMAEWWFGEHKRPITTLAYMLMGEGVGSGIVTDNMLLLGKQGTASEIGHVSIDINGPRCECGNYGCLELYCSTPVILARAKQEIPEIFDGDPHTRTDDYNLIFNAARNNNEDAKKLMKQVAKYIAYGCVTLINAYNPDIIVIGDVLAQAGDILLPIIRENVEKRTIPELFSEVEIKFSALPIDPTLYGAAAIATDKVLSRPSDYLTSTADKGGE